jgi:streptomycin 6-kinase
VDARDLILPDEMRRILPDEMRRMVIDWFGEKGRVWCNDVPGVAARLLDIWQLTPRGVLPGATHALVLDCTRADGSPAVLKLPFVDDENQAEADVLRLYDGDGAVRLLDDHRATGALLLERLVPGAPLLDHPDRGRALDIACAVLRRLRRPAPADHRFPLLKTMAAAWAADLPIQQKKRGDPLPGRLIDRAAELARDLGTWSDRDVVVNRDAHLGNFLSAGREPWLLIDPKPVLGEPAFDGSFLLLANLDQQATHRDAESLIERLSDGLAVDADRVRGWAIVRAVDNVLWALGLGDAAKAAALLAKARLLSEMD